MKTTLQLLLCLGAALVAHGANFVGDQALNAPFVVNEAVNVVGVLTLASPGSYTATNWNLVGPLRLVTAGDYTLVATSGSIAITGPMSGPAVGHATLRIRYTRAFSLVGTTAGNVTLVDDTLPRPGDGATSTMAPLTNLSIRTTLSAGGSITLGFVVGGRSPQRVLVRAVGAGLAKFGVEGTMGDPQLEVFNGAGLLAADNDGGGEEANASPVAFPLEPGSKDAAVMLTLGPGAYTVVVKGATANDRGEVLAEVYLLP